MEHMVEEPEQRHTSRFPAAACDMSDALGAALSLAGIRADEATLATFPKARAFSGMCTRIEALPRRRDTGFVHRTVAGAAQFRRRLRALLLLPVSPRRHERLHEHQQF